MTTDVRTLLHQAADAPQRAPDIERAMRAARDRRRRGRGVGALVAVVVLAFVVGAFALGDGGGDNASVAVAPRQTPETSAPVPASIPAGWQRVEVRPDVAFALPPGWSRYDFGHAPGASLTASVGTSAPADRSVMMGCTSDEGQNPTVAGTWLSIWEYPSSALETGFESPDGTHFDSGAVAERPVDFRDAVPLKGRCPFVGNAESGELSAAFEIFVFRIGERVFVARTVVAHPVVPTPDVEAAPRLSEARQVLNTFALASADEPTTTSVVDGGSIPLPPATTTVAPFVATTDDERAIDALIGRWLHYQDDDAIRQTLVDADSILDLIHEGTRQYQVNMPDGYSGQLRSLTFPDATHAEFVFDLLLHGGPLYTNQRGAAVEVDGRWMIARESECSLLALGQLICPPA